MIVGEAAIFTITNGGCCKKGKKNVLTVIFIWFISFDALIPDLTNYLKGMVIQKIGPQ